jgi:NAD(P)-dependent dehydrogenase (short-subunit alcohol dehydrogenase family)
MDAPITTVVMTGATSGIGRAAAVAFARRHVGLVLPVRDLDRGETTATALRAAGAAWVETVGCDLGVLSSVREAAAAVRAGHDRVDVLVHDASVFLAHRELTAEGHERMVATNLLGPLLLTELLTDLLVAAAPSRIVMVTAPSTTAPHPDDLESSARFRASTTFGRTKAAELMVTYALARRLSDRGVRVNAYHPGVTRTTGLYREAPVVMKAVGRLLGLAARTPERAAEGLVDLALSPRFASTTGQLIHDGRPIRAPFVQDVAAQEELWEAASRAAA